jgi:hypothetical protein
VVLQALGPDLDADRFQPAGGSRLTSRGLLGVVLFFFFFFFFFSDQDPDKGQGLGIQPGLVLILTFFLSPNGITVWSWLQAGTREKWDQLGSAGSLRMIFFRFFLISHLFIIHM